MTPNDKPQAILTIANHILVRQGVLDAFGHVSLRNPSSPDRFFLARSIAPELVTENDIIEFGLDGEPLAPTACALYSERVIHSALYRARPDVGAICHHHSPSIMPFCLADLRLRVVTQLGAIIGKQVPIWDQRDQFGATNHLVTKESEAMSLAESLAQNTIVLMKRHGATIVGTGLREVVFRSVYSCRDAELQLRARQFGEISFFADEEIDLAAKIPATTLSRAWDCWSAPFVTA